MTDFITRLFSFIDDLFSLTGRYVLIHCLPKAFGKKFPDKSSNDEDEDKERESARNTCQHVENEVRPIHFYTPVLQRWKILLCIHCPLVYIVMIIHVAMNFSEQNTERKWYEQRETIIAVSQRAGGSLSLLILLEDFDKCFHQPTHCMFSFLCWLEFTRVFPLVNSRKTFPWKGQGKK